MQLGFYLRRINLVVASQGAAQVVLLTQIPLIGERCGLDLASIGSLVALGTLCLMLAGPLAGPAGARRWGALAAGLAGAAAAGGPGAGAGYSRHRRQRRGKAPTPVLNLRQCALFATALLGTATVGQLQVAMGPMLTDLYGMSAVHASSTTALLLAAVAICGFLLQWGLVRRLQAPRLGLAIGALLFSGGTALLSLTLGGAVALPGLLVFVAGVAFLVPGYSALLSEGIEQRGRLFGLLSLMHTGGYTLGFALGGWIYTSTPAQPLLGMLVCAGLAAACALAALGPVEGKSARMVCD